MPYPKPVDMPMTCAKDIENLIYKHCNLLRDRDGFPINAAIIDVNGIYIPGKGRVYGNSTKGVSDVWITLRGESHCLEVKWKNDNQKKEQKRFQARQEKAGGTYSIIKTEHDWFRWINENINDRPQ